MNTLMHICCAPCANRPIAQLREEGHSVTGFWFNPNIHPYTEYQARKATLEGYAKKIGMKLIIGGRYDLRSFVYQRSRQHRRPLRLLLPGAHGGDRQIRRRARV